MTGVAPVRPYREYNKTSGDVIYASMKAALHRFTQGVAAELLDANIAVNCVGPSTAVRTPGAAQLIPDAFPTEPVEYLAETVLAMCHLPAAERTGLVAFSLHYPWSQQLPVHTLDGVHGAAAVGAAGNGQPEHFARGPVGARLTQHRLAHLAEAVADAVSDDHVGGLGVEPTIDHRPVNGVHQVRTHQPVGVGRTPARTHGSTSRCRPRR